MSRRRVESRVATRAEVQAESWADTWALVAGGVLALVIAAAALAVDQSAAAAFDAPKRCVALLGLAAAALCLLVSGDIAVAWPTGRRRVVGAAIASAFAWAVVAACTSPRSAIAADALRTLGLGALALPLGASRALGGTRSGGLLGVFLAVVALNAMVSCAQAAGLELFTVTVISGRTDTGAFLGNEGVLAQVAALALVAAVAAFLVTPDVRRRAALAGLGLLLVLALAVNRNLTALVTLAFGVGLALVLARGRGALGALVLVVLVLGTAVAIVPSLRGRVAEVARNARSGDWNAVTTYRLGPWAAALEMIRARPLAGFGPGTFAAEFSVQRLKAELRYERRLTIPLLTSSFSEAHSEYLQSAAEAGLPAALAVVVAVGALLAGLVRIAVLPDDARSAEALVLAALLGAGAVAALTWFPAQRPITAVPLLLAAGRGWVLLDAGGARAATKRGPRSAFHSVGVLLAVLVLGAAVWPEVGRYRAERALATASAAIGEIAAGGRIVPEAAPTLDRLAAIARATAAADPADSRGFIAAGTAALVAGKPGVARSAYRAALDRGERAEIDLNLARAFAVDRQEEQAAAALLRAVWLSPALIATLPSAERPRLDAALALWTDRLERGALTAPPPLPDEVTSAAAS